MNDLLTPSEVAKLAQRTNQTVWRDIKRGILPAKRYGWTHLVAIADVPAYLARPKETHKRTIKPLEL